MCDGVIFVAWSGFGGCGAVEGGALKLQRVINRSPRLVRLHQELVALLNDDVHKEVIRPLETKILGVGSGGLRR